MEGLELICFQIISATGTARSLYIEAIHEAKKGNFELAQQKIEEGKEFFNQGHDAHLKLVQSAAQGDEVEFNLLLLHAEDLQMSAECFSILAEEFIDVYKSINA